MSSHQTILDDLRGFNITPSRSNNEYIFHVESWYMELILAQSDLHSDCLSVQNWIVEESLVVTDYLKRIWEDHKGRYDAVIRKHKDFLAKPVVIPGKYHFSPFHSHVKISTYLHLAPVYKL